MLVARFACYYMSCAEIHELRELDKLRELDELCGLTVVTGWRWDE